MSSFKICRLASAIILFSFLTLVHFGCQKDSSLKNPKDEAPDVKVQNRSYISPLAFAGDCGRLHNEGLQNMLVTIAPSSTYESTATKVNALLSNSLNYLSTQEALDFTGLDISALNSALQSIDEQHGFTSSSIASTWSSYRNSQAIISGVSSNELFYVDELHTFFHNGFSGLTKTQACAAIVSKCNNLIADFNNHTWANGEGTLAYGLLSTTKGSAEYWSTNGSSTDGQTAGNLINIDAGGFLVGWAVQLASDLRSPNDCTDPSNRIGEGLHGAVYASGGFALRLWSIW